MFFLLRDVLISMLWAVWSHSQTIVVLKPRVDFYISPELDNKLYYVFKVLF